MIYIAKDRGIRPASEEDFEKPMDPKNIIFCFGPEDRKITEKCYVGGGRSKADN